MYFDPDITAAFTGHRTYRGEAGEQLAQTLRRLYADGYRVFMSGMAIGFDLAAAEAVLALKEVYADVTLVCVVPFAGQEQRFGQVDRGRYMRLLSEASVVDYVLQEYAPWCYAMRNDRLVANASVVVAWYDGSPGGTKYTVRKAYREGVRIVNLCEPPSLFQ